MDEANFETSVSDFPNSKAMVPAMDGDGDPRQQSHARKRLSIQSRRSSIEIQRYAEDENDEDFSDILGNDERALAKPDSDEGSDRSTLMLSSKLSNNSWLGDMDDEDDPFAQLEEDFDEMDLEANIARDKYARLRSQVESLVSSLKTSQEEDALADISEQLVCYMLPFLFIVMELTDSDGCFLRFARDKKRYFECPRNASHSRNSRHLSSSRCHIESSTNRECGQYNPIRRIALFN